MWHTIYNNIDGRSANQRPAFSSTILQQQTGCVRLSRWLLYLTWPTFTIKLRTLLFRVKLQIFRFVGSLVCYLGMANPWPNTVDYWIWLCYIYNYHTVWGMILYYVAAWIGNDYECLEGFHTWRSKPWLWNNIILDIVCIVGTSAFETYRSVAVQCCNVKPIG